MTAYLAENLKTLRRERNITQKDLADFLKISWHTVSHWETGYTEPPIAQLITMADYFQITVDELLREKL